MIDATPPSIPAGLVAANVSVNSFTLSWNASTDNVGVAVYEVYCNDILRGTTGGTSMTVSGLTQLTTYSMQVCAKDAAGNSSSRSTALPVTTLDGEPPSIPVGLVAANVSVNSFTLSWNASTDNVGVTAYEVRKNGVTYQTVTGTSASVTSLWPDTDYVMNVRARDAAGNWSDWSTELTVRTPPPDSLTDTDGDGVTDLVERQLGTNPHAARQTDSTNQSQLKIHQPTP